MGALVVRVLGELTVDGIDLGPLDRKARTLLRLLALARGRPVSTDALAEALWGERAPARPADQLAVLASRLRKVLGRDGIEHGDGGYRLRAARIDLAELESVVGETERRHRSGEVAGAAGAARVALALVRGPVPPSGSDAPWVASEEAAADRLVRRARQVAAAALGAAGSWLDAVDLAAADVLADPLDEDAVRTLMRGHVALGRTGAALAAYADLRTVLAEQLGAEPAPPTQELHLAILRGDLPAAAAPVGSAGVVLIGRDSQLAHLDTLLARTVRESGPRVAVVSGEAGIGKTTLLDRWTEARRDAGDLVLAGTCQPLDRTAPLDVVLAALGRHLRGAPDAQALLAQEAAVLAGPLGHVAASPAASGGARTVDPVLGPDTLFAALTAVLGRVAGDRGAVLVVDDAHLAGQAFADWLAYVLRRPFPLLVVAGVRPDEGPPLPATDEVAVGPLDRRQVAELVGELRADELHRRSGGHPLFLTELAASTTELPASLVAAVVARCEALGTAAEVIRAAAVLGGELDVELLAAVLGRRALDVLADAEFATRRGLLTEMGGQPRFRHELVREALVIGTAPGRVALLHREAGRVLAQRPGAEPAAVADHARRGGDHGLAARSLRIAAARAAERFDHATAEALLDESLALVPDDDTRLARAHVRIRRGRYRDGEADAIAATGAATDRWEVAAWASYFDRRFDDAIRYAEDGVLAAGEDDPTRVRCLIAAGRVQHAVGDLAAAGPRLEEALRAATGEDRVEAAAWLGVLHAHRSRVADALRLLRPATRPGVGVDHTSASLHALLFTGHTLAVAGRAADALACFERYTAEVERRDVPRFVGRGVNFAGWVLRNVGETSAGRDAHEEAAAMTSDAISELRIAALEDLADDHIRDGDPAAASRMLAEARTGMVGDLVFGWRLAMKLRLLEAQVALLSAAPEDALRIAETLRRDADAVGVARYASCARVLVHRARAALGVPVDGDEVWRDLRAVGEAVRVEAWWWAGQTGAELGSQPLVDHAEELVAELARHSGHRADALRREADRRLDGWRAGVSAR